MIYPFEDTVVTHHTHLQDLTKKTGVEAEAVSARVIRRADIEALVPAIVISIKRVKNMQVIVPVVKSGNVAVEAEARPDKKNINGAVEVRDAVVAQIEVRNAVVAAIEIRGAAVAEVEVRNAAVVTVVVTTEINNIIAAYRS